jgi:hypothetical protein
MRSQRGFAGILAMYYYLTWQPKVPAKRRVIGSRVHEASMDANVQRRATSPRRRPRGLPPEPAPRVSVDP